MSGMLHLFLLSLDDRRYALRLFPVVRVVRMVEVTAVPKAPPSVLGLINVQGEVLPVIDLRSCLGHRRREPLPQDVLVVVETAERKAAIAVDAVAGVIQFPEQQLLTDKETLRHPEYVEGVAKLPDGLVLVCDLDKILFLCSECATEGVPARPEETAQTVEEAGSAAATRRLMRERALKLSREPAAEEADQRLELVEFLLSGEQYAIESTFIREVYPLRELTPLPCTPPFVLGIVNLRGKILSVIDMRKFFDLPEQGLSDMNKVIIVYKAGMEFGILADAIVGVRTLPKRELQPSLPTLTEIRAEYLKGVTGERLVVLDAGKMLSDRRIVVHEEA